MADAFVAGVYPVWMPWLHIGNGHYLFTAGDKITQPVVYAESARRAYVPEGMVHATRVPEYKKIPVVSESGWKPYEPLDTITDTSSEQYQLLHGKDVSIDENGLIYINGYLGTALGQSYGKVGDRFIFILRESSGREHAVRVIMAEAKQYRDTAGRSGWIGKDGHTMEIVVDRNKLNKKAAASGTCEVIPGLAGEVVEILKEQK